MKKLKDRLQSWKSWKLWITIAISGLTIALFAFGYIDIDRMLDVICVTWYVYIGNLGFEDGLKELAPSLTSMTNGK